MASELNGFRAQTSREIGVLQANLSNLETNVNKIMDNHLPLIQRSVDRVESNIDGVKVSMESKIDGVKVSMESKIDSMGTKINKINMLMAKWIGGTGVIVVVIEFFLLR